MALGSVELSFALVGQNQLAGTLKQGQESFKKMGKSAKDAAHSSKGFALAIGKVKGMHLQITSLNQGFQLVTGSISAVASMVSGLGLKLKELEHQRNIEQVFNRLVPQAQEWGTALQDATQGALSTSEIMRYTNKMRIAGASMQDIQQVFQQTFRLWASAGEDFGQTVEQMMGSIIEGDETIAEFLGESIDLTKSVQKYQIQLGGLNTKLTESQKIHARMTDVTALLARRFKNLGLGDIDTGFHELAQSVGDAGDEFLRAMAMLGSGTNTVNEHIADTKHAVTDADRAMWAFKDANLAVGDSFNDAKGKLFPLTKLIKDKYPEAFKQAREAQEDYILKHAAGWRHMNESERHFARQRHKLTEENLGAIGSIWKRAADAILVIENNKASEVLAIELKAQKELAAAQKEQAKKDRDEAASKKARDARNRAARRAREAAEFQAGKAQLLFLAEITGQEQAIQQQHENRIADIKRAGLLRGQYFTDAEIRSEAKRDAALAALRATEATAIAEHNRQLVEQDRNLASMRRRLTAIQAGDTSERIKIANQFAERKAEIDAKYGAQHAEEQRTLAELHTLEQQRVTELQIATLERDQAFNVLRQQRQQDAMEARRALFEEGYQVAIDLNSNLQQLSRESGDDFQAVASTLAAASAQVARDFKQLKAGAPGAVMALGQVSAAAIRDTRAQAAVMSAFAFAEGTLMASHGNFVGSAAAFAASVMYASIAGKGGGKGAGTVKQSALGTGGGGTMGSLGGTSQSLTVNVSGYVGSTVDLGVGVSAGMAQMDEAQFHGGDRS